MGIIQIHTDTAGQVGINPRRVKIISSDNLATVTAAGYLNNVSLEGYVIYNTDIIDMWYGATGDSFAISIPGTYAEMLPSIANGIITLALQVSSGDVLLPVVSGRIATFNGTSGQIADLTTPAVHAGNIQAGLSGTAGTLSSFPATAANGSFIFKAINNSGGFASTLSNSNIAQATVYSLPDPGAATANIILSASGSAQTISGGLTISTGNLAASQGNITAGSSGHAGTLASFPGTAANGSFIIAGVNNAGGFNSTLSNSNIAQATVYSLPDTTTATANVLAAGAALVSGNLVQASGVAGAVVDSGITAASVSGSVAQLGKLFQVSVTFNTAQMVTAYDTPLQIVANPLASQLIIVHSATVYVASTGHTAYATGTAPIIQYSSGGTNGAHGVGTIAVASGLVAGDITAAASQVRTLLQAASAAITGLSGLGIYFSNATGDYTAGTGTSVTITLVYELLTATV